MVAVLALALVGCGGSDSDSDSGGDGGSAAGDGFCTTALDLADELAEYEDATDFGDDFYADVADLYRQLGDAASGDLADDFELVSDGFEQIAEWSQDPTSDYPFDESQDAELEASMERIDAAATACGIDVAGDDDSADAPETGSGEGDEGDASIDDGETLTFDDGEQSGEVGFGGELPDDFPLPVPAGFEVGTVFQFDDANGTTFSVVLNGPEQDFDDVATLYEDFLKSEGFEVEKSDISSDGARFAFVSGERSDARADITMSTEEVANDAAGNLIFDTVVSLTWTPVG
jgi:hypothetical protein